MNGNCSMTGCKSLERLPDAGTLEHQWKSIDWKKAETEVNRLQARIAKSLFKIFTRKKRTASFCAIIYRKSRKGSV